MAATISSVSHDNSRKSLPSSETMGWEGFGAELVGISAGVHRIAAMDHHRIGVHVGAPVKADCACDGNRQVRLQAHGDMDFVPAGIDGRWTDDGDCTILRIWISDAMMSATIGQLGFDPSRAPLYPRLQMRDARAQYLAWALRAEIEASDCSDPLYAQSLCTAMIVRMLGHVPSLDDRRRKLASGTAARVIDYIEQHLDQKLTLAALAALADLSVPHFKVLFRETLGMPVHRYVVQRRVERAKALLLTGKHSMSQIALDAGFAHQSHMAHWMSRLLGTSPRDVLRNDIAGGRAKRKGLVEIPDEGLGAGSKAGAEAGA